MSASVDPNHFSTQNANGQPSVQQVKDDLNRRLAKLTDEVWAKDLEIENLRRLHASEEAVSMRLKAETALHESKLHEAELRAAEFEELSKSKEAEVEALKAESSRIFLEASQEHQREVKMLQESAMSLRQQLAEVRSAYEHELEDGRRRDVEKSGRVSQLEHDLVAHVEQLEQSNQLMTTLRQALEKGAIELKAAREQADQAVRLVHELQQKGADAAETFRTREAHLNGEIARLRAEAAKTEKLLKEANEAGAQLRLGLEDERRQHESKIQELEHSAANALAELQSRMEQECQKQFEVVLTENRKFRQLLEVRDNQNEIDRNNLKQWQEQLNFFDQHLRQSKDALKRERAEILKLAKQLTSELQSARSNAFKDYVQIAEIEIAKVQSQVDNTAALSPLRAKLEERLAQMLEHRESLKTSLASAQVQIEERIEALGAIIKNSSLS